MGVDSLLEDNKLMKNQIVLKCLSVQAALISGNTPIPYSPAWIALNLRYVAVLFTLFYKNSNNANVNLAYNDSCKFISCTTPGSS